MFDVAEGKRRNYQECLRLLFLRGFYFHFFNRGHKFKVLIWILEITSPPRKGFQGVPEIKTKKMFMTLSIRNSSKTSRVGQSTWREYDDLFLLSRSHSLVNWTEKDDAKHGQVHPRR
jgi:hypothetical protein